MSAGLDQRVLCWRLHAGSHLPVGRNSPLNQERLTSYAEVQRRVQHQLWSDMQACKASQLSGSLGAESTLCIETHLRPTQLPQPVEENGSASEAQCSIELSQCSRQLLQVLEPASLAILTHAEEALGDANGQMLAMVVGRGTEVLSRDPLSCTNCR